ncbi:hypothetical protein AVEN_218895-1, partial [Araneus ventricosus]
MTQPDDADNMPTDCDLTDITYLGLALFDIRNWYSCLLMLIEVGGRFIALCWNMWNVFLDSTQLFNENAACSTCCTACRERLSANLPESMETSRNIPYTVTRQIRNSSGCWVFAPNRDEYNSKKNAGATSKGQNHASVDQSGQGTTSSAGSRKSVTFSLPVSSTNGAAKSKPVTAKKPTTPKKLSPPSQKTPK